MPCASRRLSASYSVPGASRTPAKDSMSLVRAYPCFAPSARLDRMRLAGPDDRPSVSSAVWTAAGAPMTRTDPLMLHIIYRLTMDRRPELWNSRAAAARAEADPHQRPV